jgi:hypothetical protein
MRKKSWIYIIILIGITVFFYPYNKKLSYYRDQEGIVRLTRIQRGNLAESIGGVFFTPGIYTNKFFLPDQYINPHYVHVVFSDGPFTLYTEFKGDTVIMYPGNYYEQRGSNKLFQIIDLPNFGDFTFGDLKADTTGRFIYLQ